MKVPELLIYENSIALHRKVIAGSFRVSLVIGLGCPEIWREGGDLGTCMLIGLILECCNWLEFSIWKRVRES